jgi:hypothetical protein
MTETARTGAIEAAVRDAVRALRNHRFDWGSGGDQRKFSARERGLIDALFLRVWLPHYAHYDHGLVIEAGADDFRQAYGRRGFNLTATQRNNALSHLRAALAQLNFAVETGQHRVHFHEEDRADDDRGYYELGIVAIERKRGETWQEIYRKDDPAGVRLIDLIAPSPLHHLAAKYEDYDAFKKVALQVWREVHDRGSGIPRGPAAIVAGLLTLVLSLELAAAIDPRVPTLSRVVRRVFKEIHEGNVQTDTLPGFDRGRPSSRQRPSPPSTAAATRVALPGAAVQSLVVSGSLVYVAGGAGGLFIVDVHRDAATVVGHLPIVPAQDVVVAHGVAYVATTGTGVAVIDVTNPRAPRQLTTLTTEGSTNAVSVDGERLLVAEGRGFSIYDLADARAPRRLGAQVGQNGVVVDVAARGSTLLTAAIPRQGFGAGLQSYDIADPHNPKFLTTIATAQGTPALALHGLYALVAREGAGLWVVGTEDPTNLNTVVDLLSGPDVGLVRGVAVEGDEAFLTTDRGCAIVDVSDLPRVRIAARIADATGPATRVRSRLCAVIGAPPQQQLRCDATTAAAQRAAP